jgi:hypothetical protein
MTMNRRNRVKLLAAVVGGGAMVTMGAFTAALGSPSAGTQSVVSGPMTIGATVTETTPEATLVTSVAVPPVKAPPFGGSS